MVRSEGQNQLSGLPSGGARRIFDPCQPGPNYRISSPKRRMAVLAPSVCTPAILPRLRVPAQMALIAASTSGRIGRNVLRAIAEARRTDIEVVGINDLAPVRKGPTPEHLQRARRRARKRRSIQLPRNGAGRSPRGG